MVQVVTPNIQERFEKDQLENGNVGFIAAKLGGIQPNDTSVNTVSFLVSATSSYQKVIVEHLNGTTPRTADEIDTAKAGLETSTNLLKDIQANDTAAVENALGDQVDSTLTKIANNQNEFNQALEAAQQAERDARTNLQTVEGTDQVAEADARDDLAAASQLASTGIDLGAIIQALIDVVMGSVSQPQAQPATPQPTAPQNNADPTAPIAPADNRPLEERAADAQAAIAAREAQEAAELAQQQRLSALETAGTMDYTVSDKDDLGAGRLAEGFGISLTDLTLLNPEITPEDYDIFEDQKITVPAPKQIANSLGMMKEASMNTMTEAIILSSDQPHIVMANIEHLEGMDIQNTDGIDIGAFLSSVKTALNQMHNPDASQGPQNTNAAFVDNAPIPPTDDRPLDERAVDAQDAIANRQAQEAIDQSEPTTEPEPAAEPHPLETPDGPPAQETDQAEPTTEPEPAVEPPHNPADDIVTPEEILPVEELRDGKGVESSEHYSDMDLLQQAIDKVREITGDDNAFKDLESKLDGGKFVQSADSVAALNAYTASYQSAINDGAVTRGEYASMLSSMLDTIDKTPDAIVVDRAGKADDVKGYDKAAGEVTNTNVAQIKTNLGA